MTPIARERLSLGSYHYLRWPLEYFLDTAAELGIPNVELWAAAPQFCLDFLTADDLDRVRSLLAGRGLRVCCITPEQCTYPVNLAAEEEPLRSYSLRNFERAIDAAAALSCPHVLVTAGCGYFDRPTAPAWQRAAESLGHLARYAQQRGVVLLLETLTPLSSNLLNTPEQQREMLALLPPGSTRPILDVGQMVYMGQELDRYLAHGPLLGHVHLHDSHPGIHIALGDGDLPITDYLARIEANGYTGLYSFEFNDARYRADPRAADRQSVAWLEEHGLLQRR
ncbi:MAG: sugar phosphate isomerase/epimerase [Oscillospiraceae bacterium]|nr:sugar phosphate isomerase/epimerase [Oscillospiraceae bacterium]